MPDAPTDATPDETPSREKPGGVPTINLASGTAPGTRPRRNKKKAATPPAVVQKTINLSTPKPEREESAPKASGPAKGAGPKKARGGKKGGPKGGKPQGKTRPSTGTSLADMLDPEVLAKLRGG